MRVSVRVWSYWDRPSYDRFARVVGRANLSTAPWPVSRVGPWPSTGNTAAPSAGSPNHRKLSTTEWNKRKKKNSNVYYKQTFQHSYCQTEHWYWIILQNLGFGLLKNTRLKFTQSYSVVHLYIHILYINTYSYQYRWRLIKWILNGIKMIVEATEK